MELSEPDAEGIAQTDEQTALDEAVKLKWRVYADSRVDFEENVLQPAVDNGDNVVSARAFDRQKTAVVFETVDELVDAFRRLSPVIGDDAVDAHDWMTTGKQTKTKAFAAKVKRELQDRDVDIANYRVASPAPADDSDDVDDAEADDDTDEQSAQAAAADVDAESDDGQDTADDEADSDEPDASDDEAALRDVLTPSQFRDYRATVLRGRSYDDQATATDTAPHTVRSNVSRARKALREAGVDVDGDDAL